MSEKHAVIPIFVPHKGCPHDCIFCNQRKISGQTEEMTSGRIREIIEAHLSTIEPGTVIEAGFYGGSFTGIETDRQIEFLAAANEYVKSGRISSLRLSTRPDYINPSILDYLKEYNVNTIELGVQSLDEEVLKASCRGHTTEEVFAASELINEYGFKLGIQTMTGLPCDNRKKDLDTARKVIGLKPRMVRIYPVLVIKGTYLETLMNRGAYVPQSLSQAVDVCADLLSLYRKCNIHVIRIGLQPSDAISEGSEIAGGPFHPAFRQLVEARLALREMEECILREGLDKYSEIVIKTGSGNISNVVGQKRSNLNELYSRYGFKEIRVAGDADLKQEIIVLPVTGRRAMRLPRDVKGTQCHNVKGTGTLT